ncbi:MAG: hypothetical protein Q8N88_01745 [Nanoarchaeota archaeon]|nr:hypothetical protein [Nanoarchaeota archaeon]
MVENTEAAAPQFLTEINTRLRDADERNKLIRERVLLLGKNLLSSKQEIEDELKEIRQENKEIKKELEKIKKLSLLIANEMPKFTKKEEMYLLEKMLKDFQPLEFMRKKDVEELIEEKISKISGQ